MDAIHLLWLATLTFFNGIFGDPVATDEKPDLSGPTLLVAAVFEEPFLFRNETNPSQKLEGFSVDMVDEFRNHVGFNYRFLADDDPGVGIPDKDGEWSGAVERVLKSDADIAIGPISATADRGYVVSMTMPLMETGVSMVVKKREVPPPANVTTRNHQDMDFPFVFRPFSSAVWGSVVLSFVTVVILTAIFEHVNNPMMARQGASWRLRESSNNAVYWAVKTFVLQGSAIYPRTKAGRLLLLVWSCFSILCWAMYLSGLIFHLPSNRNHANYKTESPKTSSPKYVSPGFSSETDLVLQYDILYGTVRDSSIAGFLANSKESTHRRLWKTMSDPKLSLMVGSVKEGIRKVRDLGGGYALFVDDALARYYAQQKPCDLLVIPTRLSRTGYGLALAKQSPHLDLFNNLILKLREQKVVDMHVRKWWPQECGHTQATDLMDENSAGGIESTEHSNLSGAISITQFAPLLFLLTVGVVASTAIFLVMYVDAASQKQNTGGGGSPRQSSTEV